MVVDFVFVKEFVFDVFVYLNCVHGLAIKFNKNDDCLCFVGKCPYFCCWFWVVRYWLYKATFRGIYLRPQIYHFFLLLQATEAL